MNFTSQLACDMGQTFHSRPAAMEDSSTTGHSVGILWWRIGTVYSTALLPR